MAPFVTWVLILLAAQDIASPQLQTEWSSTALPTPIIDDQGEANNTVRPTPAFENQANTTEPTIISDNRHKEQEKNQGDGVVKLIRNFLETNPKNVKDHRMYEGDMLLTPEQWRAITERKETANVFRRWPKNQATGFVNVPFLFGDYEVDQQAVLEAINHWERHTCIRFDFTNNTMLPHLRFIKGKGCYSYVGLVFPTGQDVSIGTGCHNLGIVVHEIGHAIGFYHEQSRSKRDQHVYINTDNIMKTYRSNFDIVSDIGNFNVKYDLSSVMHYRAKAFSANGGTTIATKHLPYQSVPGQRNGLSHRDILLANAIYGCINTWLDNCKQSSDPCKNEGFTGSNCECVCRDGTSGQNCTNVTSNYYSNFLQEYTEVTTNGTIITSPNYPSRYTSGLQRITNIMAPKCFRPVITFHYFRLYRKDPYCGGNLCCYFDSLEIRTEAPYSKGDVYCDEDIRAGNIFSTTGRQMVLYFETKTNLYRGWSAKVTFMPLNSSHCPNDATVSPLTTTTTAGTRTTTSTASSNIGTSTTVLLSTITNEGATTTVPASILTTHASTGIVSITATTAGTTVTTTDTSGTIGPQCSLQHLDGRYYWMSPNYPNPYPNNFRCGLRVVSDGGKIVVKLLDFDLQPKRFSVCYDKLTIVAPYDQKTEICNKLKGNQRVYVSASFFHMKFSSDDTIVRRGFNISIEGVASRCHKTIEETADSKGVIEMPGLTHQEWKEEHCEYRVKAPEGYQVRLTEMNVSTVSSKGCWKEYVLVNLHGERNYPAATSRIYCGRQYYQSLDYVTTGGVLSLAFKGKNRINRGMRATYSIAADTS